MGKTWLMKEFGRQFYQQTVYVNFDSNKQMKDLFTSNLDIEKIIMGLEIYSDMTISPENTLIIFDEVQEVPEALKSLKYFYENAPQYHIMCAGSLLGIARHNGTSFPVGKVDFLRLYPLSFDEFLLGTGNENLYKLLKSKNYDLINSFSEQFSYFLKQYYYIGGMPEAVPKARILMKSVKCRKEFCRRMSRIFPNTHRKTLYRKSEWYGTVSRHSLQRKIKNLYMVWFERVAGQRILRQLSCG